MTPHPRSPDPRPRQEAPEDELPDVWDAFKRGGSMQAREQLFSAHLPFARSIARRHFLDRRGGDIEFADLCQLASAGLLEAIDRFNPDRGIPFRGYAARRISGSVLDGVSKMSELREQISFRNRARAERARSLAPEGDVDALSPADALHALAELAVGLAIGFMLDDAVIYADGERRDIAPNAYESLAWKEAVGRLTAEIARLPDRELFVIRSHYLGELGFEQIAAALGVSKPRVSQIHRGAIELLRKRLANGGFRLRR